MPFSNEHRKCECEFILIVGELKTAIRRIPLFEVQLREKSIGVNFGVNFKF